MNGSDIGRAVAGKIAFLVLLSFAIGGAATLGAYLCIIWLIDNVSVTFS